VPAILIGVVLGAWMRARISADVFRRIVMGLLVGMSALLIAFTVFGIG
jgi:uncharacterized membrane protein YfcA